MRFQVLRGARPLVVCKEKTQQPARGWMNKAMLSTECWIRATGKLKMTWGHPMCLAEASSGVYLCSPETSQMSCSLKAGFHFCLKRWLPNEWLCPSLLYFAKSHYWENSLCPPPSSVPRGSDAVSSITSGNQYAACAPELLLWWETNLRLLALVPALRTVSVIYVKPSLNRTQKQSSKQGLKSKGLLSSGGWGAAPAPSLAPASLRSQPAKGAVLAGYGARVWGTAQGPFGTAHGAAQQLIPSSDLELFFLKRSSVSQPSFPSAEYLQSQLVNSQTSELWLVPGFYLELLHFLSPPLAVT